MSHFMVMVIGPSWEEQLTPYDENLEGCEKPRWDWYQMGGRFRGFLKLKDITVPHALGQPGVFGNNPRRDADQALKKDVDWEGMTDEAEAAAAAKYDEVIEAYGGPIELPERSWRDLVADESFGEDWDKRRKVYWNQSAMKRWKQLEKDRVIFALFEKPEDFAMPREKYLADARQAACVPFAVLVNGVWHERGEMGWWAHVTDEKDRSAWAEEVHKIFNAVLDDELITIVDCHI